MLCELVLFVAQKNAVRLRALRCAKQRCCAEVCHCMKRHSVHSVKTPGTQIYIVQCVHTHMHWLFMVKLGTLVMLKSVTHKMLLLIKQYE